MTFNEYQNFTRETSAYPVLVDPVVYPALALVGEAGEVANEVKKAMRDDNTLITPPRAIKIVEELGDVLWYVAACAYELGYTLEQVAERNKEKLLYRRAIGRRID